MKASELIVGKWYRVRSTGNTYDWVFKFSSYEGDKVVRGTGFCTPEDNYYFTSLDNKGSIWYIGEFTEEPMYKIKSYYPDVEFEEELTYEIY